MFNLAFWKWFAKEGVVPTIACFPLIEVYPVFSVSGERKTLLRSYFIDGHQKRLIAPHCVSKMYPNGPQLQLSFGPFTRITVVPTIIKAFIKQDTDAHSKPSHRAIRKCTPTKISVISSGWQFYLNLEWINS